MTLREPERPGRTVTTEIDLEQIDVQPFHDAAVVNRFRCGRRPIDQFLKNKAKKAVRRREFRVFCAYIPRSQIVIGYYALQVGADSVDELPTSKATYLKNYAAFPAVHLGFLGVHEDYQGQGLGKHLLMDAFSKTCVISDYAGFYALTLQSLDLASTDFYLDLGFIPYSDSADSPKMLYPIETLVSLVRDI
jgi:GNAT superfamily N-acetyltransferase